MLNRQHTSPTVTQRAKDLRKRMTPTEVILWQRLRAGQMCGLRFRRQEPVGNFIVDFFFAAARLVIEVDGESHDGRGQTDAERDDFLRTQDYTVLRVNNEEILHNLDGVLAAIETNCVT